MNQSKVEILVFNVLEVYNIIKGNRRQRYIAFIVKKFGKNLDRSILLDEIRNTCHQLLNKDFKEMGIRLIRFNDSTGIIKCNHLEKENTILMLKSIKKLGTKKVEIEPIGTSGTIRSLIKKHIPKNNRL